MKHLRIWFWAGLCSAGILLAVWGFFRPAPQPAQPTYWLRDLNGRVAVYYTNDPAAKPVEIYDIYVNLLPQADVLLLKQGFCVSGEAELQRILEDLGY